MPVFNHYIQAFRITLDTFLRGRFLWFFIPGLILTLLYLAVHVYAKQQYEDSQLSSDWSLLNTLFGWINYLSSLAYSFFVYLLEKVYIFIVITILSPFHAFIAERFDSALTGEKFPYSFGHFVRDILRMMAIVSIALCMELVCIFVWWVLSFIPGLALLDELMYFLIAAFFYGFAFYDYALERYRLSIGKSLVFAFQYPLHMIGAGSIFLGLYAIPYIGVPISAVITTVISTVVYLRLHKKIDKERTFIEPKE